MSRGDDGLILGTRVPDTAIHRASLWLEALKFGGDEDAGPQALTAEDVERFIAEVPLPIAPAELHEAIAYYAQNFRELLFGSEVDLVAMTPAGPMSLHSMLQSIWLDGFQHGAATAAGKRGLSHRERQAEGT